MCGTLFFVCYGIFKSTEEINEYFGFYTFFLVFDDFGNGSKQLKSAKRVETCNFKASSSMDRKELRGHQNTRNCQTTTKNSVKTHKKCAFLIFVEDRGGTGGVTRKR